MYSNWSGIFISLISSTILMACYLLFSLIITFPCACVCFMHVEIVDSVTDSNQSLDTITTGSESTTPTSAINTLSIPSHRRRRRRDRHMSTDAGDERLFSFSCGRTPRQGTNPSTTASHPSTTAPHPIVHPIVLLSIPIQY